MAYQLIERPHKFSFSKNIVRYGFNVTNPEAPGCAVEIELYTLPIDEAYDELTRTGALRCSNTLFPDRQGNLYFYCEDFLNSFLDWELPPIYNPVENEVMAVKRQICQYYIRYRQITKNNPNPEWASDAGSIRIVVKGGIAKEKFDRNNYFVNYLPTDKPFLTWKPSDHFIGLDEKRYLTYLHIQDTIVDLFVRARVVFSDGSADVVTKPFPSLEFSPLFHIPAGLEQMNFGDLQPEKQVWYYEVSVEDSEQNVYARPYRLFADYRKSYDTLYWVYHNSLGGLDSVRIRGTYDVDVTRDFSDVQQAIQTSFGLPELPTENATINSSIFQIYKGDAGWLNTKAEQDSLLELLLTDSCYQIINTKGGATYANPKWLRVVQMQKTQPMAGSADTRFSFPLQWRYTFDNSQYTPATKNFGNGENDEEWGPVYGKCQAPTGLNQETAEINGGVVTKRLFWDEVAGAIAYQVEYKEEQARNWQGMVEVTDPEAFLDFELGEYSWRVRTQCGPGDYSGYNYGPGFQIDVAPSLCSAPASLSVILLSIDSNNGQLKFAWPMVPGVFGYQIEWRPVGSVTWNTAVVTGLEYTVQLPRNIQYELRVRSKCDNLGNYSGYKYGENFIPSNMIGTCNSPNNLQATKVTTGLPYMLLTWNVPPATQSFFLQYKSVSATTWKTVPEAQPPFAVTMGDVSPLSEIMWRVRSNCTGGGYSAFTNGPNFKIGT